MSVAKNIECVRLRVGAAADRVGRDPSGVRIVGAVKGAAPDDIERAIAAGIRDLGENFVQEAEAHRAVVTDALARWHYIGHLQTNKAGAALQLFDTIQSVDSLKLAEQLSRRAQEKLQIFIEVNVAAEASKYGVQPAGVASLITAVSRLPHLELTGLMTMAPAADDPEQARPVFRELRQLAVANGLAELSMGMTDDFEVAIEEGSTMVRIGRAIFGERSS